MIVTAGVKHCFSAGDHQGVGNPDAWRIYLPKAIADRKIILTDTRQLPNPESDRSSTERHCIGRHPGVINEQLSSGTGMYLLQSTYEAIQRETKLTKKLVILDFCNANRHRSVAKGTIMSCMLFAKSIEHGLLHLNGMNNWRFMRCGGSCSHCRDVDPGRATNIAKRAFERFLPSANDHDTSDSAYQQRRPLSVSVAPRSATPGPRSTSAIRGPPATFSSAAGRTSSNSISILGPCGTTKTTNKVPTIVKQEEPEAQKPAIVTGPLTPKAKQMPVRRGDVCPGTSIPTQPAYTTGRPIAMPPTPGTSTGPRQPPTPPPSGVVEPPEPLSDQAKVKFWRDRALQAEARLQERDQQIRQQSQEILDLGWKAKVAADWTEWWEHHSHEFTPLPQQRPSTERRRSRSRSVSTSVTRRTGRSVTARPSRSWTTRRPGRGDSPGDRSAGTFSTALTALPSRPARRLWYPSPVMTVTIWRVTCHGHPGWIMQSSSRWHAADDAKSLEESTPRSL